MAGTQHYSLRWNNHQSHVLNAFDSLLQNEALVDCTLVCEDTSIRAHKVVLSACSPYFQKIFTDNPCKHPIIVLKDVRGWEVQCIVDFMYKGETSVPEAQLTSLIKAAEGLKVRGLTSSDQSLPPGVLASHSRHSSRHNSPMPAGQASFNNGQRSVHYSPSPARYPPSAASSDEPHAKVPHLSTTDQSSPMSLTTHDPEARRSAEDRCSAASSALSARASPGPAGSGPRRKQARPRRRSGDSIGNASLDLSKADSPPFRKSPSHLDDATPENLSMKRPSSSPAINLVKTETLMEDGRQGMSDNISEASSADRDHARALAAAAAAAASVSTSSDDHKPSTPSSSDHFLSAFHSNGLQQHEHEARVEALQALNYMARGMGLPPLPHPHGHPLAGHPGVNGGAPHLAPHHVLTSSANSGVIGRPTSTPSTGTSAFNGDNEKTGFEFQRISIDRTKMSEEEAFEHAIEMIQTRQMGFRKAADFFSVSKWKLYKTARKRGIYAEIKKQNQAQQALTKVPTNVQHFADLGVYKQLKKKTHLTKDGLFPHLPGHTEAENRKVFKAPTNNNNSTNNNNLTSLVNLQKKMLQEAKLTVERNSNGENDPDHMSDDEDREAMAKPETMIIRPALPSSSEAHVEDDEDVDIDEEEDERVLVINHRENETASPEEDEDSGREDSA